jgi:hypothetical protein
MKGKIRGVEFARYFLRLANLPNFALDRLSRYEANLWRQAVRILYALDASHPIAGMTSVCPKSAPMNSSDSPVVFASA